jgi:hypothetical protein
MKHSDISPNQAPSSIEDVEYEEKKQPLDGDMGSNVPYLGREEDVEQKSAGESEDINPYLKIAWKYKW